MPWINNGNAVTVTNIQHFLFTLKYEPIRNQNINTDKYIEIWQIQMYVYVLELDPNLW